MVKILVDSNISERLTKFMESELFSVTSNIAKSDYWENESSKLCTTINNSSIEISGNSGFYVSS